MTIAALLDDSERKLLELIQDDLQRPVAELAAELGLSVPAVYRRMRRLRDLRVIYREVVIVQPQTLGWPLSMLVLVKLVSDDEGAAAAMADRLRSAREVVESWRVTGNQDLVVRIVARSMADYAEVSQRLFGGNDVAGFQTLNIIDHSTRPLTAA